MKSSRTTLCHPPPQHTQYLIFVPLYKMFNAQKPPSLRALLAFPAILATPLTSNHIYCVFIARASRSARTLGRV